MDFESQPVYRLEKDSHFVQKLADSLLPSIKVTRYQLYPAFIDIRPEVYMDAEEQE